MMNEIENIKAKGKEAIVEMAFDILKERKPELEVLPVDYEITAWSSETEVIVKFRRLIRYSSADKHCTHDLSVEILSKTIAPFDIWSYNDDFFVPTKEQKETINYLKELIGLPYPHMDNVVGENDEYYTVSCTSKTAFSHHYINKKTGQRLHPLEGTYAVFSEGELEPLLVAGEESEREILVEIKN